MLQLIFGKRFEGNKRKRFIGHQQTKKNRPLNQNLKKKKKQTL